MPEQDQRLVDEGYIRRCLELARKAEGRTAPNPMVGSVTLDAGGNKVGEGYHHAAGQPHAEVLALNEAGARAIGGTLYVSLEPCCHQGRTPPCTERIIASGVRRVVFATQDPNPLVAGKGREKLQSAGLQVEHSCLEREARFLNRGFIKKMKTGFPWLTLKVATTLDGKIADRYGKSQWITGPDSRREVHKLRDALDCVLIGAGTARADNPSLNVRDLEDSRNPLRAVVDPSLTLAPDAKIYDSSTGGDTIVFCLKKAKTAADGSRKYPDTVELVALDKVDFVEEETTSKSKRTLLNLTGGLRHLAERGIMTVLCEGGGHLAGSLLSQGLVDEIYWFIAPKILADSEALCAVEFDAPRSLDDSQQFVFEDLLRLGDDSLLHAVSSSSLELILAETQLSR